MKTKIYLLFITTLFFCAGCGNKTQAEQRSVSAAKDTYVNPLFPEGPIRVLCSIMASICARRPKIKSCFGKRLTLPIWLTLFVKWCGVRKIPSNCCHLWAPEIHYINDKWYISYAADDGNTDNHQLYVLETSSPDPMQGKFEMKGSIMTNPEWNWGIQATLFEHKGVRYLAWSGSAKKNQC